MSWEDYALCGIIDNGLIGEHILLRTRSSENTFCDQIIELPGVSFISRQIIKFSVIIYALGVACGCDIGAPRCPGTCPL